jgi:17beta-estradiol 17-dehydrogenase / very-long-chain 3-oxoacyl-CoA reductase
LDHLPVSADRSPFLMTSTVPSPSSLHSPMSDFDYLHILAYIGLLSLLFFIPSPLLSLYRLFLRPAKNLRLYGQWAVITGATDGIGRAYAFQLAKQGLSLVLISRSSDRLSATEADIHKKYPKIPIKTFTLDFDQFTPDAQTALATFLQPLDIGVLLNNVGGSYSHPEYYHLVPRSSLLSMIHLNVQAVSVMIQLVLPGMLSKRRGCIVNLSSFASLISSPMLSQYSSTKSFINHLTEDLQGEYSNKGLHFQVQCPLFVTSKLSKLRKSSLFTPSPSTYAAAGIKAFGYELLSIPYWPHALQNRLIQMVPQVLMNRLVLKLHQGIKKRAEKKGESIASTQGKTE